MSRPTFEIKQKKLTQTHTRNKREKKKKRPPIGYFTHHERGWKQEKSSSPNPPVSGTGFHSSRETDTGPQQTDKTHVHTWRVLWTLNRLPLWRPNSGFITRKFARCFEAKKKKKGAAPGEATDCIPNVSQQLSAVSPHSIYGYSYSIMFSTLSSGLRTVNIITSNCSSSKRNYDVLNSRPQPHYTAKPCSETRNELEYNN